MENREKQRREAMISEAEVETRLPPRRISDAPSARGLKPRRVSAVRHWPPGCGRFHSPPPPPAINPSPRQELSSSSSALASATGSEKKKWVKSCCLPPKKRSYIHAPLKHPPSEQVNPQDQKEVESENDKDNENGRLSDHKNENVVSSAAAINRLSIISTDEDDDDAHLHGDQEFGETLPRLTIKLVSLQESSRFCAKKSVAGTSQTSPSPIQPKTNRIRRKVAKKSIRPFKEGSPGAQLSNLTTPTLPPVTISDSDARSYVKRMRDLFQKEYGLLEKAKTGFQSKSKLIYRIDLEAMNNVKKSFEYVKLDPFVGHVPGVEVGDEFRYRAELHLIGLHCPSQSGIGSTKINGILVATSVVESGGYSDRMDGPHVLIYTGSGGQPTGKKGQKKLPQDQKLKGGNLALMNSKDMKKPVRVIRRLNIGKSGRPVMKFTYDGLYMVEGYEYVSEKYKVDGKEYTAKVYKFKMRRKSIQSDVDLHVATMSKKKEAREGLCVANISQGKNKETGGSAMHHVSRPGGPHQGG